MQCWKARSGLGTRLVTDFFLSQLFVMGVNQLQSANCHWVGTYSTSIGEIVIHTSLHYMLPYTTIIQLRSHWLPRIHACVQQKIIIIMCEYWVALCYLWTGHQATHACHCMAMTLSGVETMLHISCFWDIKLVHYAMSQSGFNLLQVINLIIPSDKWPPPHLDSGGCLLGTILILLDCPW